MIPLIFSRSPTLNYTYGKKSIKKASAKLDDLARAFILIFHQCIPNLKNDIEAADTFPVIWVAQDPIMLLKLIQSLCCSYDAKT
jgi:hypothetical protein